MPQCLLLHGFTGDRDDWQVVVGNDPFYCAIDLPGHRSLNPTNPPVSKGGFFYPGSKKVVLCPFSKETLLSAFATPEDSVSFPCAEIGLGKIQHLVGYSFGGRMALALLRAAPTQFCSATIIAAHPGLTETTQREQRRAADRNWIKLLRTEGIAAFVTAWERQPLFATQRDLPLAVLARQRARRLRHNPEGLADCLEQFGLAEMPNTWNALVNFPGRLHWIVGSADQKFLTIGQRVKALRPQTQLTILEGIGHNPLLESPAQLNEILQSFYIAL